MPEGAIENPILNSPFEEPSGHFKLMEHGITNNAIEQRRAYFLLPQEESAAYSC